MCMFVGGRDGREGRERNKVSVYVCWGEGREGGREGKGIRACSKCYY